MAEILPDVDANIKKHHAERHENKTVNLGPQTSEPEELTDMNMRMHSVGSPKPAGIPGSRKLRKLSGGSFEF